MKKGIIKIRNAIVPTLRERIEDLKYLVLHFVNKYNISFNKNVKVFLRKHSIYLGAIALNVMLGNMRNYNKLLVIYI